MIQQSTIDAVNSATQSLTIACTTIMKTSDEYKYVNFCLKLRGLIKFLLTM